MNKKLIILEILAALVVALGVAVIFAFIAGSIGGNFMVDFMFMGQRGYEATGMIGIIFGLPIGGLLGAYLTRRGLGVDKQKLSQAILIGLVVGITLLSIYFVSQLQQMNDGFRFYSGKVEIESMYPEFKNFENNACFAGCSFKYDQDGNDYYFAYIVNGSGLPIAKATCFKVDKDSVVTKVGEFPNPTDSYNGYQDINRKDCSGIK